MNTTGSFAPDCAAPGVDAVGQRAPRWRGAHDVTVARESVRLFLVPGMHHCGGGPAPDRFDTLSAIEAWVEHGRAPEAIQASSRPDSPARHRLPLCPYPEQARYRGTGEISDPANWRCVMVSLD